MNKGQCETQINRAWSLLQELNLAANRQLRPIYPTNAAALFRGLGYVGTWEKCFTERYYHFQLSDLSLVQFRIENYNPLKVSYSYYECPYLPAISYEDFLTENNGSEGAEDEWLFQEEYENMVARQIKDMCTPIRYDYDTSAYMEGRHPASHIHFGHANNVRIATKKVMRPLSFILLVLRQVYPDYWQELLGRDGTDLLAREVNINLDAVTNQFWNTQDAWELVLE